MAPDTEDAPLARVSVLLDVDVPDEQQFDEYFHDVSQVTTAVVAQVYGRGYTVKIVLDEGSLWVKVTVLGGLLLRSVYPDFKAGLEQFTNYAAAFGETLSNKLLRKFDLPPDAIEKRRIDRMIPGRVLRTVQALEKLKEEAEHVSARQVREGADRIAARLNALEKRLSKEEFSNLFQVVRQIDVPELPSSPSEIRQRLANISPRRKRAGGVTEMPVDDGRPVRRRPRFHREATIKV